MKYKTWLGLELPKKVAQSIAQEGYVRLGDLHITVAHFGKQETETAEAIQEIIHGKLDATLSLRGRLRGFAQLLLPGVTVARVDLGPEAPAWRRSLLEGMPVTPSERYPWNPHVTLAKRLVIPNTRGWPSERFRLDGLFLSHNKEVVARWTLP